MSMLSSLTHFSFPIDSTASLVRRPSGINDGAAVGPTRKYSHLAASDSHQDSISDPLRRPSKQQRKSSFFDTRRGISDNALNTSAGTIVLDMGPSTTQPAASSAMNAQKRRMMLGVGFTSLDVMKWVVDEVSLLEFGSASFSSNAPRSENGQLPSLSSSEPPSTSLPTANTEFLTSLLSEVDAAAAAVEAPTDSVTSLIPGLMDDEVVPSATATRSNSVFPTFESQSQSSSHASRHALASLYRAFMRAQERTAAAAIKAEEKRKLPNAKTSSKSGGNTAPAAANSLLMSSGSQTEGRTSTTTNPLLKRFRAAAVVVTSAFKFRSVKLEGASKRRAKAMASRVFEARDAALRVAVDVAYGGAVRYDRSEVYRKRRVSGFNSSQAGKILALRPASAGASSTQTQKHTRPRSPTARHESSPDEPHPPSRGPSPPEAPSPNAQTTTHPPVAVDAPIFIYGPLAADDNGSPSLELSLLSPAKHLGRVNSASIRSVATTATIPPHESVAQLYLEACSALQLPVNRSVLRIIAVYDEHQYRSKGARKVASDHGAADSATPLMGTNLSFSGKQAGSHTAHPGSWSPSAPGLETPMEDRISSTASLHRGTPGQVSDEELTCDFSKTYCGCNGIIPIIAALDRAWALRRLSFAGCGVNDAAVIQLCAVLEASCPKLQHLDLSRNSKIGFSGGNAVHNLVMSNRKLTSVVLLDTHVRGSTARSIDRRIAERKKGNPAVHKAMSLPPMVPSTRRLIASPTTASSSLLRRWHGGTTKPADESSSSDEGDESNQPIESDL